MSTGWRKIALFFNISFEIKDKSIEFDENRNVVRAEFVVRAFMRYEIFIPPVYCLLSKNIFVILSYNLSNILI